MYTYVEKTDRYLNKVDNMHMIKHTHTTISIEAHLKPAYINYKFTFILDYTIILFVSNYTANL